MARRSDVELMRTLDEKFVADWVAFQTMCPTAGVVLDGAPYRRPDGTLDRDALDALVRHLVASWPALRMRIRPMPLGVTTPAWVTAEPELDRHVRIVERVDPDELPEVLAGGRNPDLAFDRPLWTLLIAGLPDGDVALVPRVQHALGDGIFALRLIDHLTADAPFEPEGTAPAEPLERAASPLAILFGAFRVWWRDQDGARGAWREYTRKSLVRRLRRTGGRILRPRRIRAQQRTPLPLRHHAYRTLELREAKLSARAAGASLHDYVVGCSVTAAAAIRDDHMATALLVPVSRRAGSTGEERNNISMTQVEVPAGASRAEAVEAVAEQLAAFVGGDPAATGRSLTAEGYTSYLPWRVRPRYAGRALVRRLVLWPVLDPRHPFAIFASSYAGTLSIAVSGSPDIDVEAIASDLERHLVGDGDALTAAPAREGMRG